MGHRFTWSHMLDNAAMIGAAGTQAYLRGHRSNMEMNGQSGMELKSI